MLDKMKSLYPRKIGIVKTKGDPEILSLKYYINKYKLYIEIDFLEINIQKLWHQVCQNYLI